jgi:integrase
VTVLQSVLKKAVAAGELPENPAAHLVRLGEPEREMKWLPSSGQWDSIVDRMVRFGRGSCRRAADLATLLCYTGCQLSEVSRIRWADVDFDAKMMVIHGSEGRKKSGQQRPRMIPLHRRLDGFLQKLKTPPQLKLLPSEFVAPARECLGTLQRACRELGFRPLTHHDLRHIFATWCVEQGVDIPTVADLLGHRDGGKLLLRRYRHLRMDHLKAVGAKLNF